MDNQTPIHDQDTATEPTLDSPALQPAMELTAPAESRRKLWLLAIIAAATLTVGVVALLIVTNKSEKAPVTQQVQQSTQKIDLPTKPGPQAIVYSQQENTGIKPPDCGELTKATIYRRSAEGGERQSVLALDDGVAVGSYQVTSQSVVFSTSISCGTTAKAATYASNDGGQSISKLTEGFAEGREVTSLVISTDAKKAVVATVGTEVLAGNISYNIDLGSKKVTQLFTSTAAGVFLRHYNSSKGEIYFGEGCYFCDGNSSNDLKLFDAASKSSNTLFDKEDSIGMGVDISTDASKILYWDSVLGDGLGGGPPYTLLEFTVATKKFQVLKELGNAAVRGIGYRLDDQIPYYIADKGVYGVSGSAIFEAEQPIIDIHYFNKDTIIFSAGEYNKFAVQRFDFASKKSTTILNGDENTRILGVTTQ